MAIKPLGQRVVIKKLRQKIKLQAALFFLVKLKSNLKLLKLQLLDQQKI